jgi:hypothetical protein
VALGVSSHVILFWKTVRKIERIKVKEKDIDARNVKIAKLGKPNWIAAVIFGLLMVTLAILV